MLASIEEAHNQITSLQAENDKNYNYTEELLNRLNQIAEEKHHLEDKIVQLEGQSTVTQVNAEISENSCDSSIIESKEELKQ